MKAPVKTPWKATLKMSGFAFIALLFLLIAAGCQTPSPGSDALSENLPATVNATVPACVDCHSALDEINPLLLNGQTTSGKHITHVTGQGLACETCHTAYRDAASHMDSVLDTADPAINLIAFDTQNPDGAWGNDSGPGTGGCANTVCHGQSRVAWYAASTGVACKACHYAGDSINPLLINGSTTAGKHIPHVQTQGFYCEKCHLDYDLQPTHRNGLFETDDPGNTVMFFDDTLPLTSWVSDTGAGTGGCANSCHGGTIYWY